jgi:hypothetical protein
MCFRMRLRLLLWGASLGLVASVANDERSYRAGDRVYLYQDSLQSPRVLAGMDPSSSPFCHPTSYKRDMWGTLGERLSGHELQESAFDNIRMKQDVYCQTVGNSLLTNRNHSRMRSGSNHIGL